MPHHPNNDVRECTKDILNLLQSRESIAQGAVLEKSAGKDDPVQLGSSPTVGSSLRGCSMGGSLGYRKEPLPNAPLYSTLIQPRR